MVPDPSQSAKSRPPRTWNWTGDQGFSPLHFYREGWALLRQDWLVFLWKVLADFLGRAASVAVAMLIFTLFLLDFESFHATGAPPLQWLDRLANIAASPAFIIGLFGVAFFSSIFSIALRALVTNGIWALLAQGLKQEPIIQGKTFFSLITQRFPDVLSLFFIKAAFRFVTVLLAIAWAVALLRGLSSGALLAIHPLGITLLLATSLSFLLAWVALTRLAMEAIGAPLILDHLPLGEAILRGAAFVVGNFWALYRILLFYLALLLVPLGVYWLILMVQNALLFIPILAPLGSLLRLIGDLFLTISISVLGVLFYGAIFAFYHHDDEAHARQPSPTFTKISDSATSPPVFRLGTTIEDLLPESSPHRFSLSDALPGSEPDPDPDPDPDP